MKWPFQSKTPAHISLSIDKYQLDAPLREMLGLIEFSNIEYETLGRRFEGEKKYNAPPVIFLGHPWKLKLGTVRDIIYEIAIFSEVRRKEEENPILMEIIKYWVNKIVDMPTMMTGLIIWHTTDANVVLQSAETAVGQSINLVLTSNSIRNFKRL
jgi:hypothetical protein